MLQNGNCYYLQAGRLSEADKWSRRALGRNGRNKCVCARAWPAVCRLASAPAWHMRTQQTATLRALLLVRVRPMFPFASSAKKSIAGPGGGGGWGGRRRQDATAETWARGGAHKGLTRGADRRRESLAIGGGCHLFATCVRACASGRPTIDRRAATTPTGIQNKNCAIEMQKWA